MLTQQHRCLGRFTLEIIINYVVTIQVSQEFDARVFSVTLFQFSSSSFSSEAADNLLGTPHRQVHLAALPHPRKWFCSRVTQSFGACQGVLILP